MIKHRSLFLGVLGCLVSTGVFAADACESRLAGTGMMFTPNDAKIICAERPSAASQDCTIEVLTKAKGKLRNADIFEVAGLCKAEPSPKLRECLVRNLKVAWNDPKYVGVRRLGGPCIRVASRPSAVQTTAQAPAASPSKKKVNSHRTKR